jgi:hypothetical protein
MTFRMGGADRSPADAPLSLITAVAPIESSSAPRESHTLGVMWDSPREKVPRNPPKSPGLMATGERSLDGRLLASTGRVRPRVRYLFTMIRATCPATYLWGWTRPTRPSSELDGRSPFRRVWPNRATCSRRRPLLGSRPI